MVIATNGQMGVSGFASNCSSSAVSSSGLSFHWRPTFGVDFKVNRVKRGRVFKASLKGGSDGILEKEFEFKPSFDDYLKVMESVKTVRDKKRDSIGSVKLMETPFANRNEKDVNFENKKKQPRAVDKNGPFKSRDGFRKQESSRKNVVETNGKFGDKQRSLVGIAKDIRDKKHPKQHIRVEEEERKEVEFDNYSKVRSSEVFEKKGSYRSTGEAFKTEKLDVGSNKSRAGFERSRAGDRNLIDKDYTVLEHKRTNRRTEASSNVERAAFRYLDKEVDCIKDGRQRPRAEMDERIQKLAKSLNGADVDMPEWMFTKTMRSAQIIFTDHSISRVIQILGKYGNWRRVLQVIEWLQIRERFESHKLRYVYTTALYVLGQARRPVEALNVFNAMLQQMSSYPDLVAYRSIAVTLGQAGYMKELFDVIETMRSPPKKNFKTGALREWDPRLEPDIVVYNAVLNACVKRKQWEGAFWVLQQLKEKDLKISVTTYGLLMEVMYACGKYNLVHDFFKKVQKISVPNALTYRVLVNTLWKEGKLDEAVQVVQEMEKRGVVGSAALYYDFARCLCSVGRCRDALKQIEKICKVASKPLVVTYTGLMQACLDSGKIEDGSYIFNHMKEFCSPNLVTCNILLKSYLEHGMFKEGEALFSEMLEYANCSKSREKDGVLVSPDIYTFNTFLEACVAEKRWAEFEYAFKNMLHLGFHFNSKRHLKMILEASRAGKEELLDITWDHLVETGQSPSASLAKQRFCMKVERQDYECALLCVRGQYLSESPEFSKKAWSRLLSENSAKFQKSTLDRLVHEIIEKVARTEQLNLNLNNLLVTCKEISRTFDRVNVELPESLNTLQTSLH